MENVSILGCGTMGHSIALSAAWAGLHVKVYGVSEQDLEIAKKGLQNKIKVMKDNGLFDEKEAARIMDLIKLSISLEEVVKETTFIIEVIPEVLDLKKNMYKKLEALVDKDVIIASNTSGFMPSLLAEGMDHPNRFVVTHFWNPGHLIPLVEVVKGEKTDNGTVQRAMQVLQHMKKKPVLLNREIPGFIGNRLQYALFREAQSLLDAGVATKEDIDAAVTYSIGRRLPVTGPLMTADMGGLDVFSAISNYLFEDLSTDQKSGRVLTQLVEENKLGDKSGEGFYTWDEQFSQLKNVEREQMLIHFLKGDMNLGGSDE
ncbi:3-hydroxyacyl-CoA dehydrogenase NAD-binding domain-containing protein [Psychrobacillus sp. MER TA 171]|uniref:3-hydroxyacyl-CoA dehydrogenase family protein n=1 Tax=Psychrobacillus sp. MER TA 171 TaxID=2939577 RepID=UPI00203A9305|nr:3-hydroxyacyl-CoA dehydrogenase NAD-binding domain-containing protein [Psychrobacillus sp. MER TA 171]MCM3357966.1 3-hydroxyacyl-CoA dehydrogenase NAD-binding domain-containing protein [Psychrobacillus sp. MER TA 171]